MPPLKPLTPEERRIYVEALESEGLVVSQRPVKERELTRIVGGDKKHVKLAVVSDTHLGSNYQQLSALTQFYKVADEWGADAFLHGGDLVDGSYKMHRDHIFTNFVHGHDPQLDYAIEHYPTSNRGALTYVVQGNHDYSFSSDGGGNVIEHLARARKDIRYLGYHSAFVQIGPVRIFLVHGTRGGLSYARSYKIQKLAEQLDPSERDRTQLMLVGHFHVATLLPRYQGMDIALLPCFQSQTPFLRQMGLAPVIGGMLLEIEQDRSQRRTKVEFVTYDPVIDDYPR